MERDGFKCRMCGACCRIKDGIVRVSDAEIARIAAFLGMDETEFIERETEVAPDRKSLVLKSRPDQFRKAREVSNLPVRMVKPRFGGGMSSIGEGKTRREITK